MLYLFNSAADAWRFCSSIYGLETENEQAFKVTIGIVDKGLALVYIITPVGHDYDVKAKRLATLYGGRSTYSWSGSINSYFRIIIARFAHRMASMRPVTDFIAKGASDNVPGILGAPAI